MHDMLYTIDVDLGLAQINAHTAKQALQVIADRISTHIDTQRTETVNDNIVQALMNQSSWDTFSLGEGVVIPHLKVPGIHKRFVALATLRDGINLKSIDDIPVDIIAVFISPVSDGNIHLRGLSRLSRLLKNKMLQQKLREARDGDTLKTLFSDPEGWLMAA